MPPSEKYTWIFIFLNIPKKKMILFQLIDTEDQQDWEFMSFGVHWYSSYILHARSWVVMLADCFAASQKELWPYITLTQKE